MLDEFYIKRALELAEKGAGKVNPNPLVGAVLVKNNKIIGEGYHKSYGSAHAEVNAISNAAESTEGATIYVTLEPCCHYGKTPPCVNAIIKNKIKRVVVGALDQNPLVAGKGIKILRDHGIEVTTGILEAECKKINEIFMKFINTKKPFVIMKSAMSLDGKTAAFTGDSKWITSEESRLQVHKLRNRVSAIMVGIGTVLTDNPMLTCRIPGGSNPKRIIVDSKMRIPLEAKALNQEDNALTIVAATEKAPKEKLQQLTAKGIQVLILPEYKDKVDLAALIIKLGELNIDSILLEGGSTLNYSALEQGIVDKVQFYIAPKIIGGENAKTPVGGAGASKLIDCFKLNDLDVKKIGEDILIEGYLKK